MSEQQTKKATRKKPYTIRFTGISTRDVINMHFGNITTSLLEKDSESSAKNHTYNTTEFIKDTTDGRFQNAADITMADILHEDDKMSDRIQYFFDTKKVRVKTWPVMMDNVQKGPLPLYTNKPCRWCHHAYETHPFGCPIKYNPHISSTTVSNVHNTNSLALRDRVTSFLVENNLACDTNDFFETEHMFCSLPCVKSYILGCLSNNNKAYKYKKSLSYLTLLYKKMYDVLIIPSIIPKAGPIEVLEAYGGHLTIKEYRASFGLLNYEETSNVRRPYMFSSSDYIEETKIRS